MGFRIVYTNPQTPVPLPERYEGYDLESAFYDYVPAGIGATVELDGYALDLRMPPRMFIGLVRQALPLAEQLSALPPDVADNERRSIPQLPPGTRVYGWLFADFMYLMPAIIFATDGESVWIFTRTVDESEGLPLIVLPERDREEPVLVPRTAVIEEIRAFLTRYLDDLVAAFPFLREDEVYRDWRRRIAALRPR